MNAKEYLLTIRALDIQIKQKASELEDLHSRSTAIKSFDYSRDRVQTSPSGEATFAKVTEKLVELSGEIDALTARYAHMIVTMNEICRDALTPDEYLIISLRYFHNWRWSDILHTISKRDRAAYRLCSKALGKLQDIGVD